MRIAVIGDIHANLPALRAVIDDVAAIGATRSAASATWSDAGRIPNEVVDELRRLDVPTVQGNWDEALGMDRDQTGADWPTRGRGDRQRLDGLDRRPADRGEQGLASPAAASMRMRSTADRSLLFHGTP